MTTATEDPEHIEAEEKLLLLNRICSVRNSARENDDFLNRAMQIVECAGHRMLTVRERQLLNVQLTGSMVHDELTQTDPDHGEFEGEIEHA